MTDWPECPKCGVKHGPGWDVPHQSDPPSTSPLMDAALLNARVRFWACPDHRQGRVEWRDGVAHCLTEGCGLTSQTVSALPSATEARINGLRQAAAFVRSLDCDQTLWPEDKQLDRSTVRRLASGLDAMVRSAEGREAAPSVEEKR